MLSKALLSYFLAEKWKHHTEAGFPCVYVPEILTQLRGRFNKGLTVFAGSFLADWRVFQRWGIDEDQYELYQARAGIKQGLACRYASGKMTLQERQEEESDRHHDGIYLSSPILLPVAADWRGLLDLRNILNREVVSPIEKDQIQESLREVLVQVVLDEYRIILLAGEGRRRWSHSRKASGQHLYFILRIGVWLWDTANDYPTLCKLNKVASFYIEVCLSIERFIKRQIRNQELEHGRRFIDNFQVGAPAMRAGNTYCG
jgi:hypothetical protein